MQKTKGISLIVLVITIIVMIILAGAIILSLNNSGIIGKAGEAVEKTNIAQVQTLAELKWSEAYLNGMKQTYQLKKVAKNNLVQELGATELVKYNVKVTSKGVTVELLEDTSIPQGAVEKEGLDNRFMYVVLANGDIQITRYIGESTKVTIPATYDGYDVYAIGNMDAGETADIRYNIFGEDSMPKNNSTTNTRIKKLTIEEGIKEIKLAAFNGCSGLEGTLTLPKSLEYIGMLAFNKCTGLTGDLLIPEGVIEIGSAAFQYCNGFDGRLELPETLEIISQNVFAMCEKLKGDVIIPEGITVLENNVFSGCSGLDGMLKLPSTLTKIGNKVFLNCTKLNGALIIPDAVESIGEYAFQDCKAFVSIALPNNPEYKEIKTSTFLGCSGLKGNLVIPEGVTVIGTAAFRECTGLAGRLILPTTLQQIGDRAFKDCSGLTGTIPNTVILGEDATTNSGLTIQK